MKNFKYLEIDEDVNVYVVGDIHGSYELLMQKLKDVNFDFKHDLLISVGDLVDRGNQNEKCVGLLGELWFTMAKGNHEDFCVKGVGDYMTEFYHKMENNGGRWFYQLPEDVRYSVARMFDQLPILLEVKYRGKKFGFVHADIPVEDWELLKEMVLNGDNIDGRSVIDHCLWGRDVVYRDYIEIAQVDNVFLGHTVLPKIKQVGNCTFLDTGGVFKGVGNSYDLSIIKLSDYV